MTEGHRRLLLRRWCLRSRAHQQPRWTCRSCSEHQIKLNGVSTMIKKTHTLTKLTKAHSGHHLERSVSLLWCKLSLTLMTKPVLQQGMTVWSSKPLHKGVQLVLCISTPAKDSSLTDSDCVKQGSVGRSMYNLI